MFSLNTTVDDSSPMIAYDGIWEAFGPSTAGSDLYHEGSFTSTWTHSASASIRFNGTSVFVYGGKRSSYGEFVVTLDGTNTTLSAFSPNAMENSTLLFNATGMEQSWHTLTITNIGMTGKKGMDIDYITWISNITEVSSPTSTNTSVYPIPSLITYDASMSEFSWLPHNAWQQNPESTSGGRTTSMNNANVSLTFQGQAISLIGPIGSNFSSTYTVSLDGSHPHTFSGSGRINRTALLYHADNLGPGNHTIIITNRGDITPVTGATSVRDVHARQTGTGSQNFFGVDQAQIWQGDIVTTPTPSIPPSAPATHLPSSSESKSQNNLSTGAIVGIALGSAVFVSLLVLLLLLNKRNKTLWARLQKGYMVQSQSDPPSPSNRGKYEKVDPFPFVMGDASENNSQTSIALTHQRDRTGSTVYTPYKGFGKSRSKRYAASDSANSLTSNSNGGDHDHPLLMTVNFGGAKSVVLEHGIEMPSRSATLMTASTLVAENGINDDEDEEMDTAFDNKPIFKKSPRGAHNPSTPTASSFSADSALAAFPPPRITPRIPSTVGSGTRRLSHMSQSSRFSLPRKRWTRSASPSQTRLLNSNAESHSDMEEYNDDYAGANFYAEDAKGMLRGLRSPTLMSLARSQSDAQTPVRGRLEDEENEENSFSGIQVPSWLGNGTLSFPSSFAANITLSESPSPSPSHLIPSPDRQMSKDTLPIYSSRVPTLDLPPPFPSPPASR